MSNCVLPLRESLVNKINGGEKEKGDQKLANTIFLILKDFTLCFSNKILQLGAKKPIVSSLVTANPKSHQQFRSKQYVPPSPRSMHGPSTTPPSALEGLHAASVLSTTPKQSTPFLPTSHKHACSPPHILSPTQPLNLTFFYLLPIPPCFQPVPTP